MPSSSGLDRRFIKLLIAAFLCGAAVFAAVLFLGRTAADSIAGDPGFRARMTESRVASLQEYIDRNELSSSESSALLSWCRRQPLVLMEIYRDDKLVFNSAYFEPDMLSDREIDARFYDWYSYYSLEFSDGSADLLIVCDELYQGMVLAGIVAIAAGISFFLIVFLRGVRNVARYICILNSEVELMESGDLDVPFTVKGTDELGMLARGLESMRNSFLEQRNAEALALQANQSLITGLSHDLRTPLTKIMLFAEILRNGKYQNDEQLQSYLEKIARNADQMKALSDDILQYSQTATDASDCSTAPVSLKDALGDPLAEMKEYLGERGFRIDCKLSLPDETVLVYEPFMKRIIDNLASNIDRYADPSEPVVIESAGDGMFLGFSVSNTARSSSPSEEGAGVGLENIRYMMLKMAGCSKIDDDDGHFTVLLLFRKA